MSCHKERCRFCQRETVENSVCFWCGLNQEIPEEKSTEEYLALGDDCATTSLTAENIWTVWWDNQRWLKLDD